MRNDESISGIAEVLEKADEKLDDAFAGGSRRGGRGGEEEVQRSASSLERSRSKHPVTLENIMAIPERFASVPQLRHALLNVEEVADLLQVLVSWVYERTRSCGKNHFPGFRLGKNWRFDETELFVWVERQRSGGSYLNG